jgi:hypothetical protein
MKVQKHKWRRRDYCYFVGRRAATCNTTEAAVAWWTLAGHLEAMGNDDIPKFITLLAKIRAATIVGKRK